MEGTVYAHRIKLVCGGQTGVDRALLDFCLQQGMSCGGWCPEGRMAEDGTIDSAYPVVPLPGASYDERTAANVRDSDATVIICSEGMTGGTLKSYEIAMAMKKPCLLLDLFVMDPATAAQKLIRFLGRYRPETLNFSGPRSSEWPEGYSTCYDVLRIFYATLQ